eukprot:snap_masked-scaffold587_size153100-processed-gene-0.18 protein:Tk01027 transcript:snap_masked-scaffold587_size153100-processed-gene-0.18-mRNA-1 annotation:"hypothetical protein DAPPUDRAFT_215063"
MATDLADENTFQGLVALDYVVIVAYFVFVLAVGLFVGASLFASNIGSGHFIGLAGSGAASGIGVAAFEFTAIYFLMMLGWLFVPVYMASGVYTMPEYLRKRFGGERIRVYLSVLALLLYIFTKISADLFAGALFITQATQIEGDYAIYIAILILLAIACIFTIAGGLSAVIWTDFVQTVLMIVGAFILTGISFQETGGYHQLVEKFFVSVADNRSFVDPKDPSLGYCGDPPENSMHLVRSVTADLPWTGMLFGLAINSIWYWCSDQVIVQRTLASKDMIHAKGGTILAGYLKLLPLWIMVFPGMASRVLFPNSVACATPDDCFAICKSRAGCTNIAFIKLVNEKMPMGLRGLMLAVMLAALMSSLTSIFNSSSTIFTMDIYPRFRSNAKDVELLIAGRMFVLVLVVVSIIWIPIINASQGSQLFVYIQSITSYLAPPICAIYLLAMFWPRCNEPGAFAGLMVGLIVGLIRFGLEFGYAIPPCGSGEEQPPQWWFSLIFDVHYLHFGIILWFITGVVAIVVSLLTAPIPEESLYRLTFWSRHSTKVRVDLDEKIVEKEKEDTQSLKPQSSQEDEKTSWWRKGLNCFCGMESGEPVEENAIIEPSPEEKAHLAAEFLKEDPFWRRI